MSVQLLFYAETNSLFLRCCQAPARQAWRRDHVISVYWRRTAPRVEDQSGRLSNMQIRGAPRGGCSQRLRSLVPLRQFLPSGLLATPFGGRNPRWSRWCRSRRIAASENEDEIRAAGKTASAPKFQPPTPREPIAAPATAALGSKGGGATRCDPFLGGWDRHANDCAPFPALPRDGVQVVATPSCLNLGIALQGRAAAISPLPARSRGERPTREARPVRGSGSRACLSPLTRRRGRRRPLPVGERHGSWLPPRP